MTMTAEQATWFAGTFDKLVGNVGQAVLGKPEAQDFLRQALTFLRFLLPHYLREHKRYFTLAISTIIGLFILYLVRSSWTEQAELKLGLKKPPPPPPAWEQFPFLTRYHGGIRTLVDKAQNKPEYPYSAEEAELKALQEAAMAQKKQEDDVKPGDGGFQKRQEGASDFVKRRTRFEVKQRFPSGEYEAPVKCYLDNNTKVEVPTLLAYQGVTQGFPDPAMGSHRRRPRSGAFSIRASGPCAVR